MNVHKKWLPIVAEKTFIYSKILLILESKWHAPFGICFYHKYIWNRSKQPLSKGVYMVLTNFHWFQLLLFRFLTESSLLIRYYY
jgi:hypothetical protein